jgi:hypothetical protein
MPDTNPGRVTKAAAAAAKPSTAIAESAIITESGVITNAAAAEEGERVDFNHARAAVGGAAVRAASGNVR